MLSPQWAGKRKLNPDPRKHKVTDPKCAPKATTGQRHNHLSQENGEI